MVLYPGSREADRLAFAWINFHRIYNRPLSQPVHPSTLPCGTPDVTLTSSDNSPLTLGHVTNNMVLHEGVYRT